MATIQELIGRVSGQVPDAVQQQVDKAGLVPVDSSWIDYVSYIPEIKALRVELASGDVYTYYNVQQSTYERIITDPSPGSVINRVIKTGFHPFSRG